MNEIYFSRWKSFVRAAVIILCTLGYFALLFIEPSDHPYIPIALKYFLGAVIIIGGVVLVYASIFIGFGYLVYAFGRHPMVIITDDKLQIYDMSIKRYLIFDWKDVVKIESVVLKGDLAFDVYVNDDKRYQFLETSRWRRFMLKFNALVMQGAAVRIPVCDLDVDNNWLFNELQSHITPKTYG
jgi:hypothetical protein